MPTLLELRGVSKAFGGLDVISRLNLHLDEGEIVSVIGPNGAGKTTLFNLVTGIYRPDDGDIVFDGKSIVGLEPHKIARLGNVGFVLLIAAVIALSELRGIWRTLLLAPTLYLAAFVWENRLIAQPSVTRQLLFGAILVAMMTRRPHGLLGTPRVENPI